MFLVVLARRRRRCRCAARKLPEIVGRKKSIRVICTISIDKTHAEVRLITRTRTGIAREKY